MPACEAPLRRRQAGATIVEFGLIVLLFFAFLFAVIELARMMFLFNTLQEVTRRAAHGAAVTSPGSTAMDDVRTNAIFRSDHGGLAMMSELTDLAVRIDYLSLSRSSSGAYAMQEMASGAVPTSPGANRQNCLFNPYASNCIRLVRARICEPQVTDSCRPMQFRPMITFFPFSVPLPMATTIVKAQSLGEQPN
ncbi:TadE/TadG family type IV pilus assembly protein [Massilia sp. DWR3-1-1]|uniref:TadE/TadG family type IV pilus assembly protein n=1 Tax=Massilia sp. DWR3-1-1 TaxID=2804559 RepID=UPI003CEB022D